MSDQLETGKFIIFRFGECYKCYILHLSTLFSNVEVSYFLCMYDTSFSLAAAQCGVSHLMCDWCNGLTGDRVNWGHARTRKSFYLTFQQMLDGDRFIAFDIPQSIDKKKSLFINIDMSIRPLFYFALSVPACMTVSIKGHLWNTSSFSCLQETVCLKQVSKQGKIYGQH